MIAGLIAALPRLARLRVPLPLVAALALLLVLLMLGGPAACARLRSQAAHSRLVEEQGAALARSARDAVAVQGRANRREQQSEALSRSNEEEIRNAKGADQAVDPHVRDAGLAGLCRRAAYRDGERCKLLGAAPR